MVTWMRMVGWNAQQLQGGYKSWRRFVIDALEAQCPTLPLRVLVGATGSAKTSLLHALAAQGHQVLDLEGLAVHKGSILGAVPSQAQPSQTAFETSLAHVLEKLDPTRPLYVEGESRKIGRLTLPTPLVLRLRASPCIEIHATPAARLDYLLRDYAYLGDAPQALADKLGLLKDLHGKLVIERWQSWALAGDLRPLFAELMSLHYDPLYSRSQSHNFSAWATRQTLETDDLTQAGVEALAESIATLPCV